MAIFVITVGILRKRTLLPANLNSLEAAGIKNLS